jgi:hypothetical protein
LDRLDANNTPNQSPSRRLSASSDWIEKRKKKKKKPQLAWQSTNLKRKRKNVLITFLAVNLT